MLKSLVGFGKRKPLGGIGALLILLMIVLAAFGQWIAPYRANAMDTSIMLAPPSLEHWFGTDELGRDILSRVIVGSRVSVYVGFIAVLLSSFFGLVLGLISGYYPGKVDNVLQRVLEVFMSIPGLILAMTVIAALGQSLNNVVFSIAIVSAPRISRIIRGSVISIKQEQFIEASRSVGAGDFRLIVRHVLPNVAAPMIILATISLGGAIMTEGGLSFLGLGPPPPDPTWGRMLSGASAQYLEMAPWMAIFPGLAISLAVLSFNFLGDALRDVLDPRLRGT